jgi:hypothetical protein
MSSVEMLSDGLIVAEQVQIISDDNHIKTGLEAGLKEDWRYVVLNSGGKETRHIYMKDGARVNEKVPGSEYIEDMSFDTKGGDRKGGRLLRIFIRAAYGAADDRKTVDLNRTILTHAADGVLGEWGEKAAMGRILRYRLRVAGPATLDAYGSINEAGEDVSFDNYRRPDTWKSLSKFGHFTELDAHLTLKPKTRTEANDFVKFVNASNESNEAVVFTWIAADETIFVNDIVNSKDAKQNPEAIRRYLEMRVSEYLKVKRPWDLLKDKYGVEDKPEEDTFELPKALVDDPFNIQATDGSKGFQMLAVTSGQVNNNDTQTERRRVCVDVEPVDGQKYNLGAIVDMYKDSYMIVVASYRTGEDSDDWTNLPVYVKLGDTLSDGTYDKFVKASQVETFDGITHVNMKGEYKNVSLPLDEKTGRRYFALTGTTAGNTTLPFLMQKRLPEDFAHMIPHGAAAEDILYGPTNHAVYADIQFENFDQNAGIVFLLNGAPLSQGNVGLASTGYVFQHEPGLNSVSIRYYGYNGPTYSYYASYIWGARSMYFYDAAKEKFPAPTGAGEENFNENAGAAPGEPLNYRLPFSVRNSRDYINRVTWAGFSDAMEGRDNYVENAADSQNNYGMMHGMGENTLFTVYSLKHLQSWHKYPGTIIEDMLINGGGNDNRRGFRWDRSWNFLTSYGLEKRQKDLWEQRHILKFTVLEVTRDILPEDIEDEDWRYKIHHGGGGETVVGDTLTGLGAGDFVHKAGDLFIRAEVILQKKGAKDFYNSRDYVYSKPMWFGKFRGDVWRGDDPSPFKKLGNTMQHIVADPEPLPGDSQSYRRRNMRVRSWKESFLGWDFSKIDKSTKRYVWWDFVNEKKKPYSGDAPFNVADDGGKKFPPDFFETVFGADGRVDTSETGAGTAHSVWVPPIAINMNGVPGDAVGKIIQSGDAGGSATANTFGQYMSENQYVMREQTGASDYAYTGEYGTDNPSGESKIYGRLSYLRPWRAALPNQTTPIFGLYAMRGWDFGTSERGSNVYDSINPSSKRFLRIVQGVRLPYQPNQGGDREYPVNHAYKTTRDRIFGIFFWMANTNNVIRYYDSWIGEGFSPREVRAILGLRKKKPNESEGEYIQFIRGTYVNSDNGPNLEDVGFYVPNP